MVTRENKNSAYAKSWKTNKEYYGIFENSLFKSFQLHVKKNRKKK